ncbi:TPA: putative phage abortive infection protein [Photobacterium damselae]
MKISKKTFTVLNSEQVKISGIILLSLIFVSGPYITNFWDHEISNNTQDWGAFGSYLGGLLSPILAIGSLYYVVKTFRQQSFENTFNLLLEQHNTLADKISNDKSNKFSIVRNELNSLGEYWLNSQASLNNIKNINDCYEIHQYLRVVYQVLKFIDENCPNKKKKYSRIFRSFLSNDLTYIIGLNSAQYTKKDSFIFPKYKALIEKFSLLEHLYFDLKNIELPINKNILKPNIFILAERYELSAFGDRYNITIAINTICQEYIKQLNAKIANTDDLVIKIQSLKEFSDNKSNIYLNIIKSHMNKNKSPSKKLKSMNEEVYALINHKINLDQKQESREKWLECGNECVSEIKTMEQEYIKILKEQSIKFEHDSKFLQNLQDVSNYHIILSDENINIIKDIHIAINKIHALANKYHN